MLSNFSSFPKNIINSFDPKNIFHSQIIIFDKVSYNFD